MDKAIYFYIGIVVIIGLVFVVLLIMRRRRGQEAPRNPYVEALRLLIDGDREGAFTSLQQAVKSGVAPTDAYIKLGGLLRERGDVHRALQVHQSLTVKTDLTRSEKVELYLNLADDYDQLGDSENAIRVLDSASRRFDLRDPEVYLSVAKHYHRLGQTEKAHDSLKDAKRYGVIGDREIALYLSSTAEKLLDDGNVKEARKVLQRALKLDADCAPCLFTLGNLAEEAEDLDDAIERWKRVAVLSPQLAQTVLDKLERSLFNKGRFGDIEQVYNEVRAERRDDEAASLGLAAFYKKQGRGEEAIQLLEDFVAAHPNSVKGSLLLTSLYARYREPDAMERFLQDNLGEAANTATFTCRSCSYESNVMRWHCPQCNAFDSFSSNHES